MRTSILWLVLLIAAVTQTACTPFFYGGVWILGEPKAGDATEGGGAAP